MKWYGFYKTPDFRNNTIRNYKRRLRLKSRAFIVITNSRVGYRYFDVRVYIPSLWQLTIIKSNFIKSSFFINLVSDTYYFNFIIPTFSVLWFFDKRAFSFSFRFSYFNNYFNLYWFFFFFVFNSLSQVFFNKIRFRGKGYYVYKNYRQTLAFQFGFSHRVRVFIQYLNVKFLSKTCVFLFGLNKSDILYASYFIFNKRPINVFTGKGVRFTRQIIYRKAGKISLYR